MGGRGEVGGLEVLMRLKNGCSGVLGQTSWVERRFQGEWVHGLISLEEAVSDDDKDQEVTLSVGEW